jgi:hypothetical protein
MIDLIIAIATLLGTGQTSEGPQGPMGPVPAPLPPADSAQ